MPAGLGNAIIVIRGVDLFSKEIRSIGTRYTSEIRKIESQNTRLTRGSDAITRSIAKIDTQMVSSASMLAERTTKIANSITNLNQQARISSGKLSLALQKDVTTLANLYAKVPAAQQAALTQVDAIAKRMADRTARITQASSQQQRAGLIGAQKRDIAAIDTQLVGVQALTNAERRLYSERARGAAMSRVQISNINRQRDVAVGANQAELRGIQQSTQALQFNLNTERNRLATVRGGMQAAIMSRQQELAILQRTEAQLIKLTKLQTLFSNMSSFGLMASALVTFPIVSMGTGIAKVAVDFDKAMRNIQSIGQQTDTQLATLSDRFLALSTDITKTTAAPTQLAEAFYEIQSAAFYGAAAQKILETSTKAATAGLSDQTATAKAISVALHAYNVGAEEATHFTDVMIKAVDIGIFKFEDLTQQMGDFIGAAGLMKVPIEEVMAAMTTMTKRGIQSAEAATSLNRILMTYLKPSKQQVALAQELGIELSATTLKTKGLAGALEEVVRVTKMDEDVLAQLFSEMRAVRGIFAITSDGLGIFNNDLKQLQNSMGSLNRIFGTQTRSWAAFFSNVRNLVHALAISFGKELLPMVAGFADRYIKPLIQGLTNLDGTTKRVIIGFTAFAAALGPMMIVIGAFGNAVVGLIANLVQLNATLLLTRGISLAGLLVSIGPLGIALTALAAGVVAAGIAIGKLVAETKATTSYSRIFEDTQATLTSQLQAAASAYDNAREKTNLYTEAMRTGSEASEKAAALARDEAVALAYLARGRARDTYVRLLTQQADLAYKAAIAGGKGVEGARLALRQFQLQLAEPFMSPMDDIISGLSGVTASSGALTGALAGSAPTVEDYSDAINNLVTSLTELNRLPVKGALIGDPQIPELNLEAGVLGIDTSALRDLGGNLLAFDPANNINKITTLNLELKTTEERQTAIITKARELATVNPAQAFEFLAQALNAVGTEEFLAKFSELPAVTREAIGELLNLGNISSLDQVGAQIDDITERVSKLLSTSIALPGEGTDLFEIDATAYLDYLNQLQALPGVDALYAEQVAGARARLAELRTAQWEIVDAAMLMNREVGSTEALQFLAEQALGAGASISDLMESIGNLSPVFQAAVLDAIGVEKAIQGIRDEARKPITVNVMFNLMQDALGEIQNLAVELSSVYGVTKAVQWYDTNAQKIQNLKKELMGTGSTALEAEMIIKNTLGGMSDFVDGVISAVKDNSKAVKDAASEAQRAWEKAIDGIQSKLDEGVSFSTGLGDLTGGGIMAPGQNGAFEAIYRLQDIAMNLGKPTEGADTKKWYQMYFGGIAFEDAVARATDIVKKFQQGIFTPDVTQFIDEQKLVDTINMEKIAAASKLAYADALLKAHPELDQKNLNSLLGIKEDGEGNFSVPDMTKVATAVQAQFATAADASKLDVMSPMLGLNNLDAILTSDKFKGVIPLISKGMETAIIADTTLATQGERAFDKFEGGFVNRARNSSALKRTVELMILDALNEDED